MTTCKKDCGSYSQCSDPKNKSNLDIFKSCIKVDKQCLGFKVKPKPNLCECCGHEEQWILKSAYTDGEEYHVCSNCLPELTTYSLTPKHFKNLLKNGHNASEFLLHGDFYDDDGNAQQSMFQKDEPDISPETGGGILIQAILPKTVEMYMDKNPDFYRDFRNDVVSIYRYKSNKNVQVKIPLHPEYPDYRTILSEAIMDISVKESKNFWEVVMILLRNNKAK